MNVVTMLEYANIFVIWIDHTDSSDEKFLFCFFYLVFYCSPYYAVASLNSAFRQIFVPTFVTYRHMYHVIIQVKIIYNVIHKIKQTLISQ